MRGSVATVQERLVATFAGKELGLDVDELQERLQALVVLLPPLRTSLFYQHHT